MDPSIYAYLNAILDANPETVRLALDTSSRPEGYSVYDVAMGPTPDGQMDIAARVALEADPDSDDVNRGYDAGGIVVVVFRC